ncbi:MAG: hypothetical protein R2827_05555 [Bdellovibrionales bacterium]
MTADDSNASSSSEFDEYFKFDPDYDPNADSTVEHGIEVNGGTITFYPSNKWSIWTTLLVSLFLSGSILTMTIYLASLEVILLPYTIYASGLVLLGYFLKIFGGYLIFRPQKVTVKLHRMGIFIEDKVFERLRKRAFKLSPHFKFIVYRTKKAFRVDGKNHYVVNFQVELHDGGQRYIILDDASEYGLRVLRKFCNDNQLEFELGTTKFNIVPFFVASFLVLMLVIELKLQSIV